MRDPEFAGLGALVTGGASGIGRATARLLADRGAMVVCLDLAPAPLDHNEVLAAGGTAGDRLGDLLAQLVRRI